MRNKNIYNHPVFLGFNKSEGGVCSYAKSSLVEEFDKNNWQEVLYEHDRVSQTKAVILNLQKEFGENIIAAAEFIQQSNKHDFKKSIYLENEYFGKWFIIFMGNYKNYLGELMVNPECHPRHFDESLAILLRKETVEDLDIDLSNQITVFEYRKWLSCRLGQSIFSQVDFVREQNLFTDKWKISITKNESNFSNSQLFNLVYEYEKYKGSVWDYERFLASNMSFRVG